MDFDIFSWICMISMVFRGFEKFWGQNVQQPVASCGPLWQPVAACGSGLDPPNIKISDSGGLDLEAWCLDAGCWQDWNGLEEVTEGCGGGDWKKFPHAQASGARRISSDISLELS